MSWLLRSDSLPSSLKSLKQYILEQKGGVLTVGKFRGRYFNEVGAPSLQSLCYFELPMRSQMLI